MRYGRNVFCAALFSRISEKRSASYTVQQDRSGILWSAFVVISLVVVGGWTRTKHRTRRPATLLVSWLPSVKDTTICCLADNNIFFQWVFSVLPSGSTSCPVFLTRKTEVQVLLPPHAEARERFYPWMPKLATERSISRLLCLFPSKTQFFLFPSLFPFPSLSLFLFLASHRLAESQARVVGGGWSFIPVPTTLCCMGGWVGVRRSGAKEGKGGEKRGKAGRRWSSFNNCKG